MNKVAIFESTLDEMVRQARSDMDRAVEAHNDAINLGAAEALTWGPVYGVMLINSELYMRLYTFRKTLWNDYDPTLCTIEQVMNWYISPNSTDRTTGHPRYVNWMGFLGTVLTALHGLEM